MTAIEFHRRQRGAQGGDRFRLTAPCIGHRTYDRMGDLPSLIGLEETERRDLSEQSAARLLRRIGRALRRERALGRSVRGGYDPARHLALLKAYRFEIALNKRTASKKRRA